MEVYKPRKSFKRHFCIWKYAFTLSLWLEFLCFVERFLETRASLIKIIDLCCPCGNGHKPALLGTIWVTCFQPNHSKGLLAVVELYSEWCGPCKSVIPTFKKIRLDQEDEATLQFITVGHSGTWVASRNSHRTRTSQNCLTRVSIA